MNKAENWVMTSEQGRRMWDGYFPIRISLLEQGKEVVCQSPYDIPLGVTFKVLKCNVELEGEVA
jgi:hypothetical protein